MLGGFSINVLGVCTEFFLKINKVDPKRRFSFESNCAGIAEVKGSNPVQT